ASFVMVGQRWDIDLSAPWDFEGFDWQARLRGYVAECGILHPPSGSDYFVFPRDSALGDLPPFAVGRPAWDNWFIYLARKMKIAVIDATGVVMALHQNHGYDHVADRRDAWTGPEGDRNLELAGGWEHVFTLLDATHRLTAGRVRPTLGYRYLRRRLGTLPVLVPRLGRVVRGLARATEPLRALRR